MNFRWRRHRKKEKKRKIFSRSAKAYSSDCAPTSPRPRKRCRVRRHCWICHGVRTRCVAGGIVSALRLGERLCLRSICNLTEWHIRDQISVRGRPQTLAAAGIWTCARQHPPGPISWRSGSKRRTFSCTNSCSLAGWPRTGAQPGSAARNRSYGCETRVRMCR